MRRWSTDERAEVFAAPDIAVKLHARGVGSFSAFGAGYAERRHSTAIGAVRALIRRLEGHDAG